MRPCDLDGVDASLRQRVRSARPRSCGCRTATSSTCSFTCAGPRPMASRFALAAAEPFATPARGRWTGRADAARLRGATSRSPRARCPGTTSCRCGPICSPSAPGGAHNGGLPGALAVHGAEAAAPGLAAVARRGADWLETDYPAIQAKARRQKGTIFWGDETGLRADDVRSRSDAPCGRAPVVRPCHKRANLGVISAVTNQGKLPWMGLDRLTPSS